MYILLCDRERLILKYSLIFSPNMNPLFKIYFSAYKYRKIYLNYLNIHAKNKENSCVYIYQFSRALNCT
jgi:hypothetical protein